MPKIFAGYPDHSRFHVGGRSGVEGRISNEENKTRQWTFEEFTYSQFPPCWFSHYSNYHRSFYSLYFVSNIRLDWVGCGFCRSVLVLSKWSNRITKIVMYNVNLATRSVKAQKIGNSRLNGCTYFPEVRLTCVNHNWTYILTINEIFSSCHKITLTTQAVI